MTQQCPVTKGEHRRHPAATPHHVPMAHGINPAIKGMQPPGRHATADRAAAEAELFELSVGHDPVPPHCKLGDEKVTWLLCCTYVVPYVDHVSQRVHTRTRSVANQRAAVAKVARAGIEPATP
jgi:hypothetical protein